MIIDTSAVIAILRNEPERSDLIDAITNTTDMLSMSAGTYLEAFIVARENRRVSPAQQLDEFIEDYNMDVVAFTPHQARLAGEAYRRFGKGSGHAAHLNFGDCITYALAKDLGQALLFKGNDFSKTDIVPAL
jgi:ribonuclease VapC